MKNFIMFISLYMSEYIFLIFIILNKPLLDNKAQLLFFVNLQKREII